MKAQELTIEKLAEIAGESPGELWALARRPELRFLAPRKKWVKGRPRDIDAEHLVYESIKPGVGGRVSQMLSPLELIERLAVLIPTTQASPSLLRSAGAQRAAALGGCYPAGC